jgi:hypothetical protein
MLKYLMIFGGIMLMCIPDDAGFLQFLIQGSIGLAVFITGILQLIDENN